VTFHDAASFVEYFKEFGKYSGRIFCDLRAARFEAVMDYHLGPVAPPPAEPEKLQVVVDGVGPTAGWCDHKATYPCPKTVEWQTWESQNAKGMSQIDFARFLESNLLDIVRPEGAVLLETCRTLEARKSAKFASSIRLDNGETQFLYEEEIQGSAQKGKLNIPETFLLGIRPFEGSQAYKVEVRLRYRIKEGALTMWYELVRPHKVLEDAVAEIFDQIEDGTGVKILRGALVG
jgi:uncharacterized protein YfdQ (DUF2303 family)